ncbi:hypothetical protein [Marispirochaeta sp.]|jgi:hypothetical protein|uniref:hypothetical protein n=1 Tax=Marispirochaeta sp. TaxID=2038653 RepID=UPI0029C77DEC|nr:hypothetical protein [Marispirochaeta sp.]
MKGGRSQGKQQFILHQAHPFALRNMGNGTIQFYLRQQNLSTPVKQALQRVQ